MLSQIQATEIGITATSVPYPEEKDIDPDEEAEQFKNMKKELMSFAKDLQWGIWARGVIYHWQSFDEMACALSSYFASSWEEKYSFLEQQSRSERIHKIKETVYELLEIFRVSQEAESAQKNSNEQMYRESALKKQIEFLQRQLDEMHPENISDVRRFEKKIQESGMNQEARKDAEKVLDNMCRNKTFGEICEMKPEMEDSFMGYKNIFVNVIEALKTYVQTTGDDVVTAGEDKILDHPEYADIGKIKDFLSVVTSKDKVMTLLSGDNRDIKINVKIGADGYDEIPKECSLVTATYSANGNKLGTYGVIGPIRMDYQKVVAVLENVGKILESILTNR